MASSVRQMLEDAPHDAASLEALLRRGAQVGQVHAPDSSEPDELILSDQGRETLAWIEALRGE